jgi:DNA-3-methyladenine glycosylase
MFDRTVLEATATEMAPLLLGGIIRHRDVAIRITEVEAYLGEQDPGSHAFRGQRPRNAVMFGEPGHLYAYFTYGMHVCANITLGRAGIASAVLLRAGEVIDGLYVARERRATSRHDTDLASGPARLCVAMGISLAQNGADLSRPPFELTLPTTPVDPADIRSGPRTGVSGEGGTDAFPWRFWILDDPTVSKYRAHVPRKRTSPLSD